MKFFKHLVLMIVAVGFTSISAAFPTTVHLTADPEYRSEGTEVWISTDKGTLKVSSDEPTDDVYDAFGKPGIVKGACLILETETESNIQFNKKLGMSGVRTVKRIPCQTSKR